MNFLGLFSCFCVLSLVYTQNGHPLGLPCSTNTKTAWLDIVLVIDVSSNMGSSNVKQLSLSLASEFGKYTIGQNQNFTSRVAIIPFASNATFIANLTTFNSANELQTALLGLKSSDSDSISNLFSALSSVLDQLNFIKPADGPGRPTAVVIFGASSNSPSFELIQSIARSIIDVGATIITVNYNVSDEKLSQLFDEITPAYLNFLINTQLYANIEWALLRTNCFCPDWQPYQLAYFNTTTNRMEKYAECFEAWMLGMGPENSTAMDLCDTVDQELVAITSQQKADFIRYNMSLQHYHVPYFYIGLHRNLSNEPWRWYDFLQGEIEEGPYTDWLAGYSENSPGNCVIANRTDPHDVQSPYKWWTTTCSAFNTGLEMQWALCASRACDSSFLCHYGQESIKNKGFHMKSMSQK